MNSEFLQDFTKDILEGTVQDNLAFYLITIAVAIVVTYIIASVKATAKEKAKTSEIQNQEDAKFKAIDANLEVIKAQVSTSVSVSESIKSKINYEDWLQKDLITLKREKIEAYYLSVNKVVDLVDKSASRLIEIEVNTGALCVDAFSECEMLQALYFPELEKFNKRFGNDVLQYVRARHAGTTNHIAFEQLEKSKYALKRAIVCVGSQYNSDIKKNYDLDKFYEEQFGEST